MADHRYVSRGGLKLEAALDAFKLDVTGFVCVDLGCNVGGFTDCLLQRGASHVYAVDTGYGQLAWKLRNDDRVTVMERTNAMHVDVSEISNLESQISGVDLATIDLAWTRQMHAIPAAMRWNPRQIITLIKPHYEASDATDRKGHLDEAEAEQVMQRVLAELPGAGAEVVEFIRSPIKGGKGKGKTGNVEYLALLRPNV
jgi:23S rRNA (cytidine1920-2'-O)/16S rRNA (cytidine1409-2'-O)-methyltransferase